MKIVVEIPDNGKCNGCQFLGVIESPNYDYESDWHDYCHRFRKILDFNCSCYGGRIKGKVISPCDQCENKRKP